MILTGQGFINLQEPYWSSLFLGIPESSSDGTDKKTSAPSSDGTDKKTSASSSDATDRTKISSDYHR